MGDHHQQHHHLFPSHFAYDPSANILGLVISLNVGNYVQCGSQIDTNGERSICIMRRLDTEPSQLGARFSRVFRILRDISSKTLQPVFFNSAEDRTFVASVYIFCLGLCAQLYTCHTQNSNQPAPRSTRGETEEKPRSTGTRSCTHRRFINGNPGYICTITIIFVNAETGLLTRSAAPDVLNWTVSFS